MNNAVTEAVRRAAKSKQKARRQFHNYEKTCVDIERDLQYLVKLTDWEVFYRPDEKSFVLHSEAMLVLLNNVFKVIRKKGFFEKTDLQKYSF